MAYEVSCTKLKFLTTPLGFVTTILKNFDSRVSSCAKIDGGNKQSAVTKRSNMAAAGPSHSDDAQTIEEKSISKMGIAQPI